MESRHIVKNVNVSIKKVRLFLPEMRKLTPRMAENVVRHMPHSAAKALHGALHSAIAGAMSTLRVSEDMLEFRKLQADQGMTLKRFRAGSRGTAAPILRRMTHITVVLGVKQGNEPKMKSQEVEEPVVESKKEQGADAPKAKEEKVVKKSKAKVEKLESGDQKSQASKVKKESK